MWADSSTHGDRALLGAGSEAGISQCPLPSLRGSSSSWPELQSGKSDGAQWFFLALSCISRVSNLLFRVA